MASVTKAVKKPILDMSTRLDDMMRRSRRPIFSAWYTR